MEDLWREHKRFILAVAAGLIAFFGGLSTVSSIDGRVRATQRQNREIEADIRSLGEALSGREGFEGGVGVTLEKELAPEVRAAVEFQPRPAFALKEGDSPFIVYRQAIEQVEATRADALRKNIGCPEDLGFVKDPPEERVRVYIAHADLIERLLAALVGVRVRTIELLKPGEADYVRIVEEPEPPGPGEASADAAAGSPLPGAAHATGSAEAPWLRRLPVRVAAVGTIDAVEMLLSSFQRAGASLEVAALRVARASEGLVRFEAELAALTLVPPAEAKSAKVGPGQRRPTPSRPGGRLR